jgi:hypothetical protein
MRTRSNNHREHSVTSVRSAPLLGRAKEISSQQFITEAHADELIAMAQADHILTPGERNQLRKIVDTLAGRFESPAVAKKLTAFSNMMSAAPRNLAMDAVAAHGLLNASDANRIAAAIQRDGRVTAAERTTVGALLVATRMDGTARATLAQSVGLPAAQGMTMERFDLLSRAFGDAARAYGVRPSHSGNIYVGEMFRVGNALARNVVNTASATTHSADLLVASPDERQAFMLLDGYTKDIYLSRPAALRGHAVGEVLGRPLGAMTSVNGVEEQPFENGILRRGPNDVYGRPAFKLVPADLITRANPDALPPLVPEIPSSLEAAQILLRNLDMLLAQPGFANGVTLDNALRRALVDDGLAPEVRAALKGVMAQWVTIDTASVGATRGALTRADLEAFVAPPAVTPPQVSPPVNLPKLDVPAGPLHGTGRFAVDMKRELHADGYAGTQHGGARGDLELTGTAPNDLKVRVDSTVDVLTAGEWNHPRQAVVTMDGTVPVDPHGNFVLRRDTRCHNWAGVPFNTHTELRGHIEKTPNGYQVTVSAEYEATWGSERRRSWTTAFGAAPMIINPA